MINNINWTEPKRTLLAGLNALRKALSAGKRVQLIRLANEDCSYPIKVRNSITDFRNYEFSIGLLKTRQQIQDDLRISTFLKYLSLNYKACYGTQEALDHYYKTGELSSDNFKSMGISHLVAVKDMINYRISQDNDSDQEFAEELRDQYYGTDTANQTHFYDHYRLKAEHDIYTIKRFKRKLWVVVLLKDTDHKPKIPFMIKVLNVLAMPLKFWPQRQVLQMPEYKCITYRIGSAMSGYEVSFQIPNKFSFK